MLIKSKSKGQAFGENAILLFLAVATFVTMHVYIKRGLQANIRDVIDDFGPQEGIDVSRRNKNFETRSVNLTTTSQSQRETYFIIDGARRKELPREKNIAITTGNATYVNVQK